MWIHTTCLWIAIKHSCSKSLWKWWSLEGTDDVAVAWKGNWEQEMKGAPESHYFTWNITSRIFWNIFQVEYHKWNIKIFSISKHYDCQAKKGGPVRVMTTLAAMVSMRRTGQRGESFWSLTNQEGSVASMENTQRRISITSYPQVNGLHGWETGNRQC